MRKDCPHGTTPGSEQSPLVIVGGRLVSDVDSGQLTTVYPPALASLLRRSTFNSDLPRWACVHHMMPASIDHQGPSRPTRSRLRLLDARATFDVAHQGGCAIPSNDPQLTARPASRVSTKALLRLLWQQQCLGLFFAQLIKGTSTQLLEREAICPAVPLDRYASTPTAIHSGLVPALSRARSRSQRPFAHGPTT
ncbi:hypothetical protein PHLGIDRAFT_449918 [Phlebiopsis gigantea 11061_1 CR5-6]|uniref:Uncharacterized protein n=1 Tax=Phlebiopsis gigantea (strain 11061_1 CR5-6) TaxID=745531 RepID=A0A0C3SA09_PHLG1|nr:hypothetical protein PHLGIDRAFT_449918 [Phlebiopsis gigantea 11061_1 CR5-6]